MKKIGYFLVLIFILTINMYGQNTDKEDGVRTTQIYLHNAFEKTIQALRFVLVGGEGLDSSFSVLDSLLQDMEDRQAILQDSIDVLNATQQLLKGIQQSIKVNSDTSNSRLSVANSLLQLIRASVETLDNAVDGNYLNTNMNIEGTDVAAGSGINGTAVQRVTIATDDEVNDNIDAIKTATEAINAKMVTGTDIGDVTINNASGASAVNIQDGGNSITVDGTVTTTATDLDIRDLESTDTVTVRSIVDALPAGTNAIGKLAANSGVDIGDVDVTSIAAGDNNIGNVDIVTLPSGNLGQQAMAASLSTVPANNITDATYIGDIKFGESLPIGSNVVGQVSIDQTTPGTTNKVDIGTNGTVAATQSGNWGITSSTNNYAEERTTVAALDSVEFGFTTKTVTFINDNASTDTLYVSTVSTFPSTNTIKRSGSEGFTKTYGVTKLYLKVAHTPASGKKIRVEAN